MTSLHEVTILSCVTPCEVDISPLLSLNGCAVAIELLMFFLWDED